MLVNCPECSHVVSDKASSCPNCGYPMSPQAEIAKSEKKKYKGKRMRLPNGFGRITKLTGKNLRKPFRVMITVGTNEFGKPIGKLLKPVAYFETYNDAYQALMDYHKDPYSVDNDVTIGELYDKWIEKHSKSITKGRLRTIQATWAYCSCVKDIPARLIKVSHIKSIIDNGSRIDKNGNVIPIPDGMKIRVKSVFVGALGYGVNMGYLDNNIATNFKQDKEVIDAVEASKTDHIPYTEDEINVLWDNERDNLLVTNILVQCYSGWRPGELMDIRISNVNLDEWTFMGGNKTDSGIDRTIPIHTKIRPLVRKLYDLAVENGIEYLSVLSTKTGRIIKTKRTSFTDMLNKNIERLGLNPAHRLHDGRVTFVTKAKMANVDEYAIKRIIGHRISDLTERVYTHRSMGWLREEIEKIE